MRYLICLIGLSLLLSSCSKPLPPLTTAPNLAGVLPGQTVWQAQKELGTLTWTGGSTEDGERIFVSSGNYLHCKAGLIVQIRAEVLTVRGQKVSAGASCSELESVWGKPENRFQREGRDLSLYHFQPYRYELEWKADKLVAVEISKQPKLLGANSPPQGVGTLGSSLGSHPGLRLDGIGVSWPESDVKKKLEKLESPKPLTGLQGGRTVWVLGRHLTRDGREWVSLGMSRGKACKRLSQLGRLRSYNPSQVTYTFLDYGDVTVSLDQDDKVVGIEWFKPKRLRH